MKTGFYLCCVGVALIVFVEVSSEQIIHSDPIDNRGLYLESAQSQNAAAAAAQQSSSYLNMGGGYQPQNYEQAQPHYSSPGSWSGSDGSSLQMGQQSSESAVAQASSNQYSKLIADGGYGGQAVNQYPQYLPSGLSSLQSQSSQSGAEASAAAHSSGSQFQINEGGVLNPYYPSSGNSQFLQQNSQAEASASSHAGSTNYLEQQIHPQPPQQFVQNPPEYFGGSGYLNGVSGASSSSASAGAATSGGAAGAYGVAGSSTLGGSTGSGAFGVAGAYGTSGGSPSPLPSPSQNYQENPLVPRIKCGYVKQCKTVLVPAY